MHPRIAIGAAAAATVCTALAVSAHFIYCNGVVDGSGTMLVSFKEAGLGANQRVDYKLTTTAESTYQCYNKGTNVPQGVPFSLGPTTFETDASANSGKNGNVVATIPVDPPGPSGTEASKCVDTGKMLCLLNVSYSATTLADVTNDQSISVTPDPTEASFPAPTKKGGVPPNCVTSL